MSEDDERAEAMALLRELAADEDLGLSPAAAGFLRDYLAREAAKSAVTTHDAPEVAGNVFRGLKVFCPRCGRELKDSGCSISFDSLNYQMTVRCRGRL